jgi:hypothetical protein
MYVHILFQNDGPLLAYVDPAVADREQRKRQRDSDGSIEQGIFHVKSVMVVGATEFK